jgi:hypothetical protein
MDFSEAEARAFLVHFFACLKGKPEDGVRASYLSLQNTFMAMRRGTFHSIQSEPPFSRFGRQNMKILLKAWLEGGETGLTSRWGEVFGSGWRTRVQQQYPVRVEVRSGESPEHAIQIQTDHAEDRVNGEYWHLYYEYGLRWRCEMQVSTLPDASGRRYDILHIQLEGGQKKRFYFLL